MKKILSVGRARGLLAAALSACMLGSAPAQAQAVPDYLSRADVLTFMGTLQSEYQFDLGELERILGDARHIPSVVQLIGPERPSRPIVRSYPKYRAKFLTPKRINAGVQYWQEHE